MGETVASRHTNGINAVAGWVVLLGYLPASSAIATYCIECKTFLGYRNLAGDSSPGYGAVNMSRSKITTPRIAMQSWVEFCYPSKRIGFDRDNADVKPGLARTCHSTVPAMLTVVIKLIRISSKHQSLNRDTDLHHSHGSIDNLRLE